MKADKETIRMVRLMGKEVGLKLKKEEAKTYITNPDMFNALWMLCEARRSMTVRK